MTKISATWLCTLLALASILTACSTTASPPSTASKPSIPKVTLIAKDLSLTMPKTLPAGLVDITMVNEGTQAQPAQFARLNQGTTLEQLQTRLQKGQRALWPLLIPTGGLLAVQPQHSQEIWLDLSEGLYVVLNFLPGDETLPHSGKALITSFSVTGSSSTPTAQLPPSRSDIKVTMKDFSFDTPETLKAGPLAYEVTNRGAQAHEMVFLKLNTGKTWKDVMAFLQSPQSSTLPGTVVGGMSALSPGETARISMSLAPGTYVILCFLPEKSSGLLHVQLGMICSIDVK